MPSFTTQVPNLQNLGPVVEVSIAVPPEVQKILKQKNQNVPTPVRTTAMIDTGATETVINDNIVNQLNLKPVGLTQISTASHSKVPCYQYLIRLIFPNNVTVDGVVAICAPLLLQNILSYWS